MSVRTVQRLSKETIKQAQQMLKQGIARETVSITLNISLRSIERHCSGNRRPVCTKRKPDPTPEEIAKMCAEMRRLRPRNKVIDLQNLFGV